jgi:hypothetical protein
MCNLCAQQVYPQRGSQGELERSQLESIKYYRPTSNHWIASHGSWGSSFALRDCVNSVHAGYLLMLTSAGHDKSIQIECPESIINRAFCS